MKRLRLMFGLMVITTFAVAPPLPADCEPGMPILAHYVTFYSDYFVTPVGGWTSTCEDQYSEWGTLDGAYEEFIWEGCCGGGQSGRRCYQKISGTWTLIACP